MSFKRRDFALGPDDSLWGDDSPLPGMDMQLLAGVDQTEGRFTMARYTISTEVFPHVHEGEDESIFLLDGEITVTVGDKDYDLVPGSFIYMPMGVPHAIKKNTETWKGLTVSSPGGPFQHCMEELLALQKSGQELTLEALATIQEKHGVRNVSPEGQWYDMSQDE